MQIPALQFGQETFDGVTLVAGQEGRAEESRRRLLGQENAAAGAGGRGVEQTARATGQGMGAGKVAALSPLPQQ